METKTLGPIELVLSEAVEEARATAELRQRHQELLAEETCREKIDRLTAKLAQLGIDAGELAEPVFDFEFEGRRYRLALGSGGLVHGMSFCPSCQESMSGAWAWRVIYNRLALGEWLLDSATKAPELCRTCRPPAPREKPPSTEERLLGLLREFVDGRVQDLTGAC